MHVKGGERGQALPESIVFLPLALLALFGTMYVSQYGVVSERSQLAVRYGGITAFQTSGLYSASDIYTGVANGGLPPSCPSPPPGILSDGAPYPAPTSAPFWQPSSAAGSCSVVVHRLGGGQFLSSHFFAGSLDGINATVAIPAYLQPVIGASAATSSSEAFAHPADPQTILYCSKEVDNRVSEAINDSNAAPSTPAPLPSNAPALTFTC